ncbi:MAG: imidazole glycerol phosphate synthase subunit HisH [Rhodospirillaceae bacterium]|nr:imidazole glycerol phosphate synthase subunit HisH [Rhodospirillaceae bacterium]MDD9914827.1 imidazole glycerol phosphate synthase subunit HisH [Rhodospirillaceae bacterium]MDD9929952.1 imidazole glycerol phosphate synthase subunit HisH [Rhodospirillaceae bacterium]
MTVAIIDYGSGNLRSAAKAFEHVGTAPVAVTADPDTVARADRVVLPGVGAFADCRRGLYALDGMVEALIDAVIAKARPFLGICVGMQLMATRGLEHGSHDGFNWIEGSVRAIDPTDKTLKIPHMGWNDLTLRGAHPLLAGLAPSPHMYFVHSYHLAAADEAHVLATVDYSGAVTAVVGRDNLVGTQFHPEKSQAMGLRLIENFLNWNP